MEHYPDISIQVQQLSKKFGNFTAVDKLDLDIRKGELFGLLGPNGAGKTTTIHMLCGLSPVSSGQVLINGQSMQQSPGLRSKIGICPQENIHWNKLSCQEQLVFMGKMYGMESKAVRKRTDELLNLLGLADKARQKAAKLSGGMKRRLNICLALIHNPEFLILDEPESGLDPQSRVLLRDFIKSLRGAKTIVLTTHNMDEADRLSDRVAILDHGKLLLLDTPGNLKRSIGEGDILELSFVNDISRETKLTESLAPYYNDIKVTGNFIMLRSKNIVEKIAEITEIVKGTGNELQKIVLRENTLEDVFIHLTGKKLRQ
ncbi:MAG: ATP-binding cassette domain-containing protein [Bacteroidales bacterium]|nr:ATP-binding cassette domain-containing protein [Bacteroidales bacterium]MCF8405260.1 ATP-binding cassette domain-containing protein [Bacteroidales bacterium]